ncbi:LPS assembly lipoprotein LptE [Hippea maritima]|uniref:Lipoprotein n=1 Tax=Hippea maritima (strain ATCC 700847 / DSM 10411 / MH2) TaxID=760142 RepID=F2LWL9_HIPMA|nr:LPS assembly lipoprotein LptE [Hippea maritima]AEA34128.1 hypothetical protein Hipma_1166 [Hippea maritima DSM 10411]
MRKIALFAILLFVYGCAYSFVGQNSSMVGNIKKVYVEDVVNRTNEPNLQVYLRGDLISTLDLDSRVSVIGRKDEAEGLLKVSIVKYDVEPISYSNSGLASRYRCSIVASVNLLNSDGKAFIKNREVESYRDFNAESSVDATEKARNNISKDVLKDLADKIKELLFVDF